MVEDERWGTVSSRALQEYSEYGRFIMDADPMDPAVVDECVERSRRALRLIEQAEKVCTGDVLAEVRKAKEGILKQMPVFEAGQKLHRGEISADEMLGITLDAMDDEE